MRLYIHPFSPNARRALMTAIHLNVPFERVLVDLRKGEHKRPEYLKLNPNGKVPTLEDDGFALWESRAIMTYLAERTPGQTIYPQELRARADVNHWMFWDAVHFSPAIQIVVYERIVKGFLGHGAPDPEEIERGEKMIAPLMAVLDGHLANREWLSGDALTLADFCVATPLVFAGPAQLSLPPNVAAWYARVSALDAYRQTIPQLP
ncbi:MAG: glutathione S-transferase family protein [Acidobacteriota bacterium]